MKVLFVGATGVVGSAIVPILQPHFDLQLAALEAGEVAGMPVRAVDIRDFEATRALVEESGADAVVNCAIADYREGQRIKTLEVVHRYNESTIDVNVRGAYHLYEAAWMARINKFVFISTMFAAGGLPRPEPTIDVGVPRPRNFYGCTKAFGEQAGSIYAMRRMTITCLRLGHPYPLYDGLEEDRLLDDQFRAIVVHLEDIAAAVKCGLHEKANYSIHPVLSACDVERNHPDGVAEIGYQPRYRFSAQGAELIES